MVGGQGATNFGGVDVVPLLGVIAIANFWGVDVVPLQGGSGRGAIAGCHCRVLL